jgi:hypothetical protein
VSADSNTEAFLEALPKGTVIKVTDPAGHSFELVAEGGAFRDFVHHKGTVPYRLAGRRARFGGTRLFWSISSLARWVAGDLCRIELAPKEADQ